MGEARAKPISKPKRTHQLSSLLVAVAWMTLALLGISQLAASAQEALVVDGLTVLSVEQRCVGESGRVDITVENTIESVVTAVVKIDKVERSSELAAGSRATITVTGRNDGLRPIFLADEVVSEVLFRCAGDYRIDDQIEAATSFTFADYDGDGIAGPPRILLPGGTASLQPGEPTECVLGTATAWLRVPAPGPSVQVSLVDNKSGSSRLGAAVYSGPPVFDGFEGLTRLGCIEPGTAAGFGTQVGDTLWIQVSGAGLRDGRFAPALTAVIDSESLAVVITTECQGDPGLGPGTGLIDIAVTNMTPRDLRLPVELHPTDPPLLRFVDVEAGQTASVRVSGRTDGVYTASVVGLGHGLGFVDCSPHTGQNDNIATARELSFTRGSAYVDETSGLTYGHRPEELELAGSGCFRFTRAGSAWYTFVATDEVVHFDGDDDATVSLWRSTVANPTNLNELESLSCADAQSRVTTRVVPGERYWFALTEKIHRKLWVTMGAAAVNDQIRDARPLTTSDLVPGIEATLEPDEPSACRLGGSLWWTFTAEQSDASVLHAATLPFVVEGVGREGDAAVSLYAEIYSSEVEAPTVADLASVGCLAPGRETPVLEPGRKYWIAVAPAEGQTVAISTSPIAIEANVDVVCTAAGTAQIDWTLSSQTAADLPYELVLRAAGVDIPQVKTGVIVAGTTQRVSISGRVDGTYAWALRASTFGANDDARTIAVDCDGSPAPAHVRVSCLSGAGRIDLFVDIPGVLNLYVVLTSGATELIRETVSRFPGAQRLTVTGRPDGPWTVKAFALSAGGELLLDETVDVSCAEPE